MTSEPLKYLFRRLGAWDDLSEEERAALVEAAGETKVMPRGSEIVREGQSPSFCTLLVGGMVAREKSLEEGGKQITAIHIAGDLIDLHTFLLSKLDHDLVALTEVKLISFPHRKLKAITEQLPHLTRLLWLSTLIDSAIHRQWLVAMGRTSALAHAAHFFCEIYVRSDLVGLADEHRSIPFAITQQQLADTLGLSAVHVSRVVQELRRQNLITWDGKRLSVLDWDGLQSLGQFDPSFLDVVVRRR
ncbi:MAG TPA: Crp/Fnr family transcriptional regulator [Devosia sp.]|jgi:CRP-like cAMP-binding protein|uniref:Crp/Fnr family transcriptional regulator n=1 Tax=Devosia sp. TaxID=1871048 RepID=UPI002F93D7D1